MNGFDRKIRKLNWLITEYMGVSQTVVDVVCSISARLMVDAKTKIQIPTGEYLVEDEKMYSITLYGNKYYIYSTYIHFRNKDEWKTYRSRYKKPANGYNPNEQTIYLYTDVIDTWINEQVLMRGLCHELSHIHFFHMKNDEGNEATLQSNEYRIASRLFYDNDDNVSKAAQAIYLRGTNEMSAFINGLYGELLQKKKPVSQKEAFDILEKSSVYKIYQRISQFDTDIDENRIPNLNDIASKFGLKGGRLKWIVKKCRKNLADAISRVMGRYEMERELNEIFNPYLYSIKSRFGD